MFQLDGLPYVMKCVPEYVDKQGVLRAKIETWFATYMSIGDYYEHSGQAHVGDVNVLEAWKLESLHPAQMVCQELAGLIFNEGTQFGTDSEGADKLQEWAEAIDYQTICNKSAEWSMALGTSAQLLRFSKVLDNGEIARDSLVSINRYDARNIFPICFTEESVTDVCFTSLITTKKQYFVQVARVRKEEDGWTIENRYFKYGGMEVSTQDLDKIEEVTFEDYAPVIRIQGVNPPFAILRPAITNVYAVNSCMGVSVFDGAIPAIKLTDRSFQNFLNDIELGQKMVFLDEDMIQGDRSNRTLPFDIGKRLFVKVFRGIGGGSNHVEEYNPDLRTDQNSKALSTALAVLGMRTGFGSNYFQFDKATHTVMTATAEILDQQTLMRTITRHENSFLKPIQGMLTCMMVQFGSEAPVIVNYDDSVIIDTEHKKEQDRADVAAGLLPAWRYIMKWRGVSEEEAKAWVAETMMV